MDRGWRQRTLEPEQLKDLVFDPHETRNLAADPDCQDHLRELRKRLDSGCRTPAIPCAKGPHSAARRRGGQRSRRPFALGAGASCPRISGHE